MPPGTPAAGSVPVDCGFPGLEAGDPEIPGVPDEEGAAVSPETGPIAAPSAIRCDAGPVAVSPAKPISVVASAPSAQHRANFPTKADLAHRTFPVFILMFLLHLVAARSGWSPFVPNGHGPHVRTCGVDAAQIERRGCFCYRSPRCSTDVVIICARNLLASVLRSLSIRKRTAVGRTRNSLQLSFRKNTIFEDVQ